MTQSSKFPNFHANVQFDTLTQSAKFKMKMLNSRAMTESHGDESVPVAFSVSKCFFKRSEISIVMRFDMVYNRKYAY